MNDSNRNTAAIPSPNSGELASPAPKQSSLCAPTYTSLPQARSRSARGASERSKLNVKVEVITPILGGGTSTRKLDEVDSIRAPTIRGHLRFWWRALHCHEYASSEELYKAESRIWGRAADNEGGRSQVEVSVQILKPGTRDDSPIRMTAPGSYALWPAREEKRGNIPTAHRFNAGLQFTLKTLFPHQLEDQVRLAVTAWLVFGGYGSRTRRGVGSLSVLEDAKDWLPQSASREHFTHLFKRDIFSHSSPEARSVPQLAGAALHVGRPSNATTAWVVALEDWLRGFRQGTTDFDNPQLGRAREPGPKEDRQRPSISNWPESDKIRILLGKTKHHKPRHNANPTWPRAGFGLPIIGRFQTKARDGSFVDEPESFALSWRNSDGQFDRLSSPLIVKALPLANNTFVPCALWLHREYPKGEVYLEGVARSGAPFDQLLAKNDAPRFPALANQSSLRSAFLSWLSAAHRTTVVAP